MVGTVNQPEHILWVIIFHLNVIIKDYLLKQCNNYDSEDLIHPLLIFVIHVLSRPYIQYIMQFSLKLFISEDFILILSSFDIFHYSHSNIMIYFAA